MASDDFDPTEASDWNYLWREIKRRTIEPLSHVPFVLYVLLAIVGFGCLGIWVELIKIALGAPTNDYKGVLTALATLFPALIGSTAHQLILLSTERRDKVLVSFGYFVGMVTLGGVGLISIFHGQYPQATLGSAMGFAALAIWMWWFTNGDDPTFKSSTIDAASGGDPGKPLKGSTSGFQE